MDLAKVDIKNFRSIDSLVLEFPHRCQALIGINESGKSNILRALQLLDPEVAPSPADLRIERHDEPQVEKGHVRFVFDLSAEEIDGVYEAMRAHFCTVSIDDPLVAFGSAKRTLRQWCDSRNQGVYMVDFPTVARAATSWAIKADEKLVPEWYRNKANESAILQTSDGASLNVPARGFVRASNVVSSANFEPASIGSVAKLSVEIIGRVVSSKLPKCIFWRYADKYLLPSSIDVTSFCATPDSCIPLKSMFELAGYDGDKLGTLITRAQTQGHHRYVQILEKTATAATDHIRSIWKDYKNVKISLQPNGANISPIIADDVVPLDMANRSDGFKRFVSFLLQVSAKVRTEELLDTLILVDEPEIALHPTGARNLMRELIEIGKTNTVVYSTHSIFMVDKDVVARHLVVEKKREVTRTWRAEKSRIQDEEVLYNAMGFSIFEAVRLHNVIFEGWRDKEIFRVVSDAMGKADRNIKDRISTIGMIFADGVKDVRTVSHFLQLASRPCLIISDADKTAIQHQRAYQVPGAWGEWKTLKDALPTASVLTGEDLILRACVVKRANKVRESFSGLNPLTEGFFNTGEATVAGLRRWLEGAGIEAGRMEEALNQVKSAIVQGVKRNEISDQAEELVRFVVNFEFPKPLD